MGREVRNSGGDCSRADSHRTSSREDGEEGGKEDGEDGGTKERNGAESGWLGAFLYSFLGWASTGAIATEADHTICLLLLRGSEVETRPTTTIEQSASFEVYK